MNPVVVDAAPGWANLLDVETALRFLGVKWPRGLVAHLPFKPGH